jgi:hypothetical protein
MTFSDGFAVVTEYEIRKSGLYIAIHAIMLSDNNNGFPIIFGYIENSSKTLNIPHDDLKSFLEKNIPEKYDVYPCDVYFYKFPKLLEEVIERFNVKKIDDSPPEIQEEIQQYFTKVNSSRFVNVRNYVNGLMNKENSNKAEEIIEA